MTISDTQAILIINARINRKPISRRSYSQPEKGWQPVKPYQDWDFRHYMYRIEEDAPSSNGG